MMGIRGAHIVFSNPKPTHPSFRLIRIQLGVFWVWSPDTEKMMPLQQEGEMQDRLSRTVHAGCPELDWDLLYLHLSMSCARSRFRALLQCRRL